MHRKFWLLSRGKASSNSTALYSGICSPVMCAVFSCVHTTGFSVTTDGYGIFNERTHTGACRTHKGGPGTNASAQELTRPEGQNNCPSPCLARGSNPGSSDFNSTVRTTTLRPPSSNYEHFQIRNASNVRLLQTILTWLFSSKNTQTRLRYQTCNQCGRPAQECPEKWHNLLWLERAGKSREKYVPKRPCKGISASLDPRTGPLKNWSVLDCSWRAETGDVAPVVQTASVFYSEDPGFDSPGVAGWRIVFLSLRVDSCACVRLFVPGVHFVCTARTQVFSNVKDPISICHTIVARPHIRCFFER